MKDKIKEIREYVACPQFGDDHYGKWGALRLDQRQKIKYLLDYITNLQEENEKLKEQNKMTDEQIEKSFTIASEHLYKQIVNKAIEYIEEHTMKNTTFKSLYLDQEEKEKLLNILQGEENENK